ncbi:hypothetical protein [Mangrovimonas futianensis]|uniref:hypothetical protein n=2 Tax=Mangrovimonas futianensis TaxID=2895523 RepID=UPI001E499997|nr:hypothetical protein [Mangrovimonas futianensis]MCF1196781.1 hypothetical protein [Mangrovimonas futianensis]MCF1423121.1 hypothetical protein [Mangrovimonas futianensis]
MKYTIKSLILFFYLSTIQSQNIECIDVYYIKRDVSFTIQINCENIKTDLFKHYSFNDKIMKNELTRNIDSFIKKSSEVKNNFDDQIKFNLKVFYSDETTEELCISESGGFLLNNLFIGFNLDLAEKIKNSVNYYRN